MNPLNTGGAFLRPSLSVPELFISVLISTYLAGRKTNIIFSLLFCFIGSKCDSLKHIENNYALLILKNFTSIIAAIGSEMAMIATVMNSAPSSS